MKNVFGILAIIAAVVAYSWLFEKKPSGSTTGATSAMAVPAPAPKSLTDDEVRGILDRGRAMDRKLADSNKPRTSPTAPFVLVTKADYEQARADLWRIPKDHTSFGDAQKLLVSIDKRGAEGDELGRKAVEKARTDNVGGRKSFASTYEKDLLRKGLSATVSTEGDKSSTLKVSYPLMSKALAFNLNENSKFTDQLRELGFRKLIMTDGYNESWSASLN
jgi:hypothetical protein